MALGILLGGVGFAGYGRTVADGPLISGAPGAGPGAVGIVLLALLSLGCIGPIGQAGDAIEGERFTYSDGELEIRCEGSTETPCRWSGPMSETAGRTVVNVLPAVATP